MNDLKIVSNLSGGRLLITCLIPDLQAYEQTLWKSASLLRKNLIEDQLEAIQSHMEIIENDRNKRR